MHRLVKNGTIRRALRGIYDYPPYSNRLDCVLTPQIDQVAQALARKFKWDIQPSGPAALNILGLSTQVPADYIYLSDGPDRAYKIANTQLRFRHIAEKESRFALRESRVIVQALKSLGEKRVTTQVVKAVREWLDADLHQRILKDTRTVTGWTYEVIREVCGGTRGYRSAVVIERQGRYLPRNRFSVGRISRCCRKGLLGLLASRNAFRRFVSQEQDFTQGGYFSFKGFRPDQAFLGGHRLDPGLEPDRPGGPVP